METVLQSGVIWWITAVDLPVLSGLFWLIFHTRKECHQAVDELHGMLDLRSTQLREALSSFKLEVAKSYACVTDMKDLETRIVGHLLRIESKLDQTALKTEALNARNKE